MLLLLQAVGLRSGYHTAIVMGGLNYKVHGLRLAQANEMQLELKAHGQPPKGVAATTHMQLDGEPWVQELPHGEDATPMQVSSALHQGYSLNCCKSADAWSTVSEQAMMGQGKGRKRPKGTAMNHKPLVICDTYLHTYSVTQLHDVSLHAAYRAVHSSLTTSGASYTRLMQ